jgi:DNA-binding beta-propeller fold protein YncE
MASASTAKGSSAPTVWVMGNGQISPIRSSTRTLGSPINVDCGMAMTLGPNGNPWMACGSSVSVIDAKTGTVAARIADPEEPDSIVFAHHDAYVLNRASPPSIWEIDPTRKKVIHEIAFTQNSDFGWSGLQYSPSLKMIYLESSEFATAGWPTLDGVLLAFNPSTNRFGRLLDVPEMWNASLGGAPNMVIAPDGTMAAFVGSDYGKVATVGLRTYSVRLSPDLAPDLGAVQNVAFSPSSKNLYVTCYNGGVNENGFVEELALPGFKVEHRWAIAQEPEQLYVNRFAVFVLSVGPTISSGGAINEGFTVINSSTHKILLVKETGPAANLQAGGVSLVFDPSGGLGWLISRSTTVTPFEIRNGKLLAPIKIPYTPSALAVG